MTQKERPKNDLERGIENEKIMLWAYWYGLLNEENLQSQLNVKHKPSSED